MDVPCTYFVVRKDQSTAWVPSNTLVEPYEVQLVKMFETRFPRSDRLPCNSVRDYEAVMDKEQLDQKIANLEQGVSDDELDLVAPEEVERHYGAPEA